MVAIVQTTWMIYCGHRKINHSSVRFLRCWNLQVQPCSCLKFMPSQAPFWLSWYHLSWYSCLIPRFSLPSWWCHPPQGGRRLFPRVTLILCLSPSSIARPILLIPKSRSWPDTKKQMSLAYTLLTPLLNPPIYSLRNKKLKRDVVKLWQRKVTLLTAWFVEEAGVFLLLLSSIWILKVVKNGTFLVSVFFLDVSVLENISC